MSSCKLAGLGSNYPSTMISALMKGCAQSSNRTARLSWVSRALYGKKVNLAARTWCISGCRPSWIQNCGNFVEEGSIDSTAVSKQGVWVCEDHHRQTYRLDRLQDKLHEVYKITKNASVDDRSTFTVANLSGTEICVIIIQSLYVFIVEHWKFRVEQGRFQRSQPKTSPRSELL